SILVSSGTTVLKKESYGTADGEAKPVEKDSLFRLFSMSKPVTVVAALILHERGEFFLDDTIDILWPAMRDLQVYESGEGDEMITKRVTRAPTVRELMMHTAGFYYPYSEHPAHQKLKSIDLPKNDAGIEKVSELIASSPLLFEPGARWNYGYSTDILAGLVEHVSGKPFDAFLREEILDPLGMLDTFYQVPADKANRLLDLYNFDDEGKLTRIEKAAESQHLSDNPVPWGGTGLVGTINDYWRFCRMLLQDGELDGIRIISSASANYMLTNHLTDDEIPFEAPGSPYGRFAKGYGFGLGVKVMIDPSINGNPVSIGETGWSGAASTHFWLIPEYDLVVMFFTQNRGYLKIQPLAEQVKLAVYHSLTPP
ncbi:MAG: serine hydrolase domain-containing protein, partial [Verrucomicrobiota bacterium]